MGVVFLNKNSFSKTILPTSDFKPNEKQLQNCFFKSSGRSELTTCDPAQLAQFINDKDQYGIIVSEGIGLADGVNLEMLIDAALSNMANAWGLNKSDIPVLNISDVEFEGMRSSRVAISAEYQGMSVMLTYTMSVADRAYQLITFRVGKNYGSIDETLHQSFIKHVKID